MIQQPLTIHFAGLVKQPAVPVAKLVHSNYLVADYAVQTQLYEITIEIM